MKFDSVAILSLGLSGAHALVEIPAVSRVVSSALEEFSPYVSHALDPTATPTIIPANPTANVGVQARQAVADPSYWLADIKHQGIAAFNSEPSAYVVFRNVKDYGAKGDGVTDDTAAINAAISHGGRIGPSAGTTSTITPAIVYFPPGTYIISSSIIDYYFTQLIGNPNELPILKASKSFPATWLIDGDQYQNTGNQGWGSTNVFFRQIRNLILDLTNVPADVAVTGIHWPTAQATSIQNVQILMSSASGTQHQGVFIENGSGGFMSDVTTVGGAYGFNVGNQQFTMRGLQISDAVVGINQIWNWGWTYQGLAISNCSTAISITNGGKGKQSVGSLVVFDSTIENSAVFVDTVYTSSTFTNGSLWLENIKLNNVDRAVSDNGNTVLAGSGGETTINGWGQGHSYTPNGPNEFQGALTPATRPSALLASGTSNYYTQSKPQYAASPVASFLSVRSAGAKGDGKTDDTAALRAALQSAAASNQILYIDQGTYLVSDTLVVPAGSRIVGEAYPVLMASGSKFANMNDPTVFVQIGNPGEAGSIQWSDTIVSTTGSTPGVILIQWNLAASEGSGLWDVHTRIGGFDGSNLQVAQCPTTAAVSASCQAAYMSFWVPSHAKNVYLENVWLWTADHDLDDPSSTQISVYTGRGFLVEGSNIWLYGTSVEHHFLYQYQFAGASNIVAGFVQTETAYYQPNPDAASGPYPTDSSLHDPVYSGGEAYGLRILDTQQMTIYGAGLYSFFQNYDGTCSGYPTPANCQADIFSIEGSTSDLKVFMLSTIGAVNQVVQDGVVLALASDNLATYAESIAYLAPAAGAASNGTTSTTSSVSSSKTTLISSTSPTSTAVPTGWVLLGCYTDNVSGRALPDGIPAPGGPTNMTVQNCQAGCQALGYTLAGVEYADECYCGDTLENGSGPAPDGNALCDMPCAGDASETCGGPNRLNLYTYASSATAAPTTTTVTATSLTVVPTTSTMSGTPTSTISGIYTPTATSVPSAKRGLAYNTNNPDSNAVYANLFTGYNKISWGYDWGFPSAGLSPSFEFVPMLWGLPDGSDPSWTAAVQTTGTQHILGFNEPDVTYSGSSNIAPEAAAEGYKMYIQPFAGTVQIGTPSVLWNNVGSSSGGDYNTKMWMKYFMGNCTGCEFNFAAVHWYQNCVPEWFQGNVTDAYETLGMPIWVTEFQCYGTNAEQVSFLQKVLPWMDAQDYVQRYAYFGVFPDFLVNSNGTGLSDVGEAYASI